MKKPKIGRPISVKDRRKISLYLVGRQFKRLQRMADDQGVKLSELVRKLLDQAIGGNHGR